MVAPVDICNQAISYIGSNIQPLTGSLPTFDGSAEGIAAGRLYQPCVQTVGRQFGWDFSRNLVVLVDTGNVSPYQGMHEYFYPTNGVEVRQVAPQALADVNNPRPVNWIVGNTLVSSLPKKVIWTPQQGGVAPVAIFSNQPSEDLWDPTFREAVARLLASELAMALFGKPDVAGALLATSGEFERIGETRLG